MPTFRVQFRIDKADQLIESKGVREVGPSYVFYREDGHTVAQIPRDVVLSVVEEGGRGPIGGVTIFKLTHYPRTGPTLRTF